MTNRKNRYWIALLCILAFSAVTLPAWGQTSIFHDPFLNWDFINLTDLTANDFEIIVETPDWNPPEVYTGFFPSFGTRPDPCSGGTVLSWSGIDVEPGSMAHVGAAMMGSGRILDAYWTDDGQKIGDSVAIVYEKTQVFPFPDGTGAIAMNLQLAGGFRGSAALMNVRTFVDIPVDFLGLNDLTREGVDTMLGYLAEMDHERTPTELLRVSFQNEMPLIETRPLDDLTVLPMDNDSFFDVFIDVTQTPDPAFESLLVADVVTLNQEPIGRFWNLNPQTPEPTALVLLAVGSVALLRRHRRRAVK